MKITSNQSSGASSTELQNEGASIQPRLASDEQSSERQPNRSPALANLFDLQSRASISGAASRISQKFNEKATTDASEGKGDGNALLREKLNIQQHIQCWRETGVPFRAGEQEDPQSKRLLQEKAPDESPRRGCEGGDYLVRGHKYMTPQDAWNEVGRELEARLKTDFRGEIYRIDGFFSQREEAETRAKSEMLTQPYASLPVATHRIVYRGDRRPPEIVFDEGFTRREDSGPPKSVMYGEDQGYKGVVSTSESPCIALSYAVNRGGYLYAVGLESGAKLPTQWRGSDLKEIAPLYVSPRNIMWGVGPVDASKASLGELFINGNSEYGSAVADFSFKTMRKELSAQHDGKWKISGYSESIISFRARYEQSRNVERPETQRFPVRRANSLPEM
ncbi:Uncharacterised protein [Burkholderia pseudomallei]|nr:Uncharacterised protein [Burkholderia pseudomallei]CAJ8999032.1 Uncharacterised protein [Burkholderia pseudomallei]CAK0466749.1 Uncharacterised protein [Burkholderia pseudomallei]